MTRIVYLMAIFLVLGGCSSVLSTISNPPQISEILPNLSSDKPDMAKAEAAQKQTTPLPRSRRISFVVAPENRWNYGDKEFEIIRGFIIDEMVRKGYEPFVKNDPKFKENPDVAVLVDYRIEPKMIQSHKVPVYGLTAPGFTTQVKHKDGKKGHFKKKDTQQPVFGVKEYKQYSQTVFMKHFQLKIVDYFSLAAPTPDVFYEAKATATENIESIIPSAPPMIRQLAADLPVQPKPAPIVFPKDAPDTEKKKAPILKLRVMDQG